MAVKHTVRLGDRFVALNVQSRCAVSQHTIRRTLGMGLISHQPELLLDDLGRNRGLERGVCSCAEFQGFSCCRG